MERRSRNMLIIIIIIIIKGNVLPPGHSVIVAGAETADAVQQAVIGGHEEIGIL